MEFTISTLFSTAFLELAWKGLLFTQPWYLKYDLRSLALAQNF